MKRKIEYKDEMPKLLYSFFTTYTDTAGAPSFEKFARSNGLTLDTVNAFRENEEFDRAYRECNEIRRDYLIDAALTRRHDPSFVKFLLGAEYGMGEKDKDLDDKELNVTLEVFTDTKNENQA